MGQEVRFQRPSRAVRAAQRPFRQSGDFVIGGRKAKRGRDARTGASVRVVSPAVSPYVFQRKGRAHTLYPTLSAFMPSGYDGTIIHNKMVHNCGKKPASKAENARFSFFCHKYPQKITVMNIPLWITFTVGSPFPWGAHGADKIMESAQATTR